MGFFDSFFKKESEKKFEVRVKLSDLEVWIESEIISEKHNLEKHTKPYVKNIMNNSKKLLIELEKLSSKDVREDMDKRIWKILKTNKPKYEQGMLRICTELIRISENPDDHYAKNVKESLDGIGKLNFGEGRYLIAAYQKELIEIQSKCRILLEQYEGIQKLENEQPRLKSLSEISAKITGVNDVVMQLTDTHQKENECLNEINAIEKKLEKEKKDLRKKESEIAGGESALDGERLEKIENILDNITDEVKRHVLRLGRGLRLYQKQSFEHGKVIAEFMEHPVNVFHKSHEKVNAMLLDFQKAVENESLRMKDKQKTIKRIEDAKKTLNEETAKEYETKKTEINILKEKISQDPALNAKKAKIEKIRNLEMKNIEVKSEKEKIGVKIKAMKKEKTGKLEEIVFLCRDMNVFLDINL